MLYKRVEPIWQQALAQPFLTELATGTLDPQRYRNYMLQDYGYLRGYMDILREMRDLASAPELQVGASAPELQTTASAPELPAFLDAVLAETRRETEQVHVPAMERLGITVAELGTQAAETEPAAVIAAYLSYMAGKVREDGLLAGLTALLQCSWHYAYIGREMTRRYGAQIAKSPYRDWFASYAAESYAAGNQRWIDAVDQAAAGIDVMGQETARLDDTTAEKLSDIFVTCAEYELQFWKRL